MRAIFHSRFTVAGESSITAAVSSTVSPLKKRSSTIRACRASISSSLFSALSTARALPSIAQAVKGDLTIFADSGVRTGLDVVRMLALGADGVLIGRAFVYALATHGAAGVRNLLAILEKDIRTSMVLTGVQSVRAIDQTCLA